MKKIMLAVFGLGALAAPALAADLAPYYRAPPPPLPIPIWSDFYFGANAGWYGSAGNTITNTGTDTGIGGLGAALALGLIPSAVSVSDNGFIGGGQIGYNYEIYPSWVVGIEADFDETSNSRRTVTAGFGGSAALFPFASVFSRELDNLGTVRGRVGWLSSPNWLWYATGGFAYGQIKLGSAWVCSACGPPTTAQAGTALQTSSTATGWTVGAGVEWRFAEAWSVKAEYLYVDLGAETNTITYTYPPFTSSLTTSVRERDNIVRLGVNYKFW